MIRIFTVILFIALIAWMNPEADRTKDGNRLYNKELYDEAMAKYTEVLIDLPNSSRLHFNIGNAAYKKENYEEAIKSFIKSASIAPDLTLESKAQYNLGNCKYRQGRLKENTNPKETIDLYNEALEHYRQAIDKNPEDANTAKYNHEFVERKIKELLDQQEKQPGQQQEQQQEEQQEQQQDQQQEQQQGQQQGQTEEQQEQQEQGDQSEEGDESENEEKNENQAKAQEEPQDGQGQEQESGQEESLTKKEAKMLLDSLKDEELRRPDNPLIQRRVPQILKDW